MATTAAAATTTTTAPSSQPIKSSTQCDAEVISLLVDAGIDNAQTILLHYDPQMLRPAPVARSSPPSSLHEKGTPSLAAVLGMQDNSEFSGASKCNFFATLLHFVNTHLKLVLTSCATLVDIDNVLAPGLLAMYIHAQTAFLPEIHATSAGRSVHLFATTSVDDARKHKIPPSMQMLGESVARSSAGASLGLRAVFASNCGPVVINGSEISVAVRMLHRAGVPCAAHHADRMLLDAPSEFAPPPSPPPEGKRSTFSVIDLVSVWCPADPQTTWARHTLDGLVETVALHTPVLCFWFAHPQQPLDDRRAHALRCMAALGDAQAVGYAPHVFGPYMWRLLAVPDLYVLYMQNQNDIAAAAAAVPSRTSVTNAECVHSPSHTLGYVVLGIPAHRLL